VSTHRKRRARGVAVRKAVRDENARQEVVAMQSLIPKLRAEHGLDRSSTKVLATVASKSAGVSAEYIQTTTSIAVPELNSILSELIAAGLVMVDDDSHVVHSVYRYVSWQEREI
jgi:hypothetical protein